MTTTKSTKPRALPWLKYSSDVDAQVAAGRAREQARLASSAVVNGTPIYRDSSGDTYVVGYGGDRNYQAPRPAVQVNGASDKQKTLIDKLLVEKEHSYTEEQVVTAKADWRLTRKMIDFLLAAPRKPHQTPAPVEAPTAPAQARLDFSAIPDSNYALGTDEEGDPIKFYRVTSNKKGFKFVQVRASDDLHEVPFKVGIAILHKIVAAGIEESQMLFANRLERCYTCGKSLTDQESRDAGQGPTCRSK